MEFMSRARIPCSISVCACIAAPARPEPLYPQTGSSGFATRQKQSPPMPVMCGSRTPSCAVAVTAASAALPPARRVSIAASVASGCEVAAIASQLKTGERPGKWKSRIINVGGWAAPPPGGSLTQRLRCVDANIPLCRADRHRKSGDHIDKADDHKQEKRRGRGRAHHHEFGQHGEKEQEREQMIHDRSRAEPRRFDNLHEQQKQGSGEQYIAGADGPISTGKQPDD